MTRLLVVDASALATAVLDPAASDLVAELASAEAQAPHLVDAEVLSVVRRLVLAGHLTRAAGHEALELMSTMVATRHEHTGFQRRALELGDNLSAYDALYVALAEALDCPLLTRDARLAASPGPSCRITLVP